MMDDRTPGGREVLDFCGTCGADWHCEHRPLPGSVWTDRDEERERRRLASRDLHQYRASHPDLQVSLDAARRYARSRGWVAPEDDPLPFSAPAPRNPLSVNLNVPITHGLPMRGHPPVSIFGPLQGSPWRGWRVVTFPPQALEVISTMLVDIFEIDTDEFRHAVWERSKATPYTYDELMSAAREIWKAAEQRRLNDAWMATMEHMSAQMQMIVGELTDAMTKAVAPIGDAIGKMTQAFADLGRAGGLLGREFYPGAADAYRQQVYEKYLARVAKCARIYAGSYTDIPHRRVVVALSRPVPVGCPKPAPVARGPPRESDAGRGVYDPVTVLARLCPLGVHRVLPVRDGLSVPGYGSNRRKHEPLHP